MRVEPWLTRAARVRPDHPAVNGLSYAQLLERARSVAGALPDGPVGIAMAPGEDFAIALHACLLAGVPAVPVDLRLGEREQAHVTAGCAVVLDELPGGAPVDPRPHDLDAPAIVVHTSGTSGTPKRVELTYGNWLWSALGAHAAMGLGPAERWLCALPLSHVGGLSILVRSAIYGTTAVVHERFDAERVLAEDFSVISVVPTTLTRLLDAGGSAFRALVGGAPIPAALVERAESQDVIAQQTYGLTEACSQVTTDGRPLFCTRVALTADGEIVVSGPTVAPGSGPDLRTGDLGAWNEDGTLAIAGRKADTIVTGGENVAPAEVEAVLEAHPAVAEAAVRGRPDPEWGEAVVASVVLRAGAEASETELLAACRAALAPFKVPKTLRFVSSLPRTPSGKLLRRHLD
jgi:O-succinylbenzoic acid--CoA ligase